MLATTDSDERAQLIDHVTRLAANGDEVALGELIWVTDEPHLARSSIRRLVVQDDDADEVEQDALVAVAETIGSFRGEAHWVSGPNHLIAVISVGAAST